MKIIHESHKCTIISSIFELGKRGSTLQSRVNELIHTEIDRNNTITKLQEQIYGYEHVMENFEAYQNKLLDMMDGFQELMGHQNHAQSSSDFQRLKVELKESFKMVQLWQQEAALSNSEKSDTNNFLNIVKLFSVVIILEIVFQGYAVRNYF